MPANSKYLSSPFQRFLKISAGLIGGYMLSETVHLAAAVWFGKAPAVITAAYTEFLLWMTLFMLAFMSKNGWKIWGLYTLLTVIFFLLMYFGK